MRPREAVAREWLVFCARCTQMHLLGEVAPERPPH